MDTHKLRAAIAARDAVEAMRIVSAYDGDYPGHCISVLDAEDFVALWRIISPSDQRGLLTRDTHYCPLLHLMTSNARCFGFDDTFVLLLAPHNRDLVDLETEIDDPHDKPDVRTTALRYAIRNGFSWAAKRLLVAGASTERVVSTTDERNFLAPYLQRRASCARLACALLWRHFKPYGLEVPRDLRVLLARLVRRKRYSKRWDK